MSQLPTTPEAGGDEGAAGGVGSGGAAVSGRSRWRLLAQTLGFFIGLGLLWWCSAQALRPENREQLSRLAEARVWEIGAMVGLTLASLVLNGSIFWIALRPVRRLRWADVVAVNIVATLLALAPAKLSVLFRLVIHRARDGVPLLTIGAWFGVVGAMLLVVVAPVGLASFLAARAEAEGATGTPVWWPAVPAAAAVVLAAGVVVVSRIVMTGVGWRAVERLARFVPGERARGVFAARLLPRAHEGVRMLGSPGAVGGAVTLRLADIAVQTGRFLLAASILQQAMSLELAVLAASAYFVIGALSPTGPLGVREAGTAGVFAVMASDGFMVVVMTVTAVETVVVLGMGVAAAGWLRVDQLVRPRPPRRHA